jgi:C1A family cysteine protease
MITREQMKSSLKRIKDKRDKRDYRFSITVPAVLPKRSSVFNYLTHIEDQTVLGSCTAQTGTTTIEAECRYHKKDVPDLSPLFHYQTELIISGDFPDDVGAEMRTIGMAGKEYGICSDASWPYIASKLSTRPPQKCFDEAKKVKVASYERLLSEEEIKACIAKARSCAMIGFPVYTSFFDIGSDGIMPMPKKGEYIEGGHAVTAYRYDPDYIWIRNSWGPDWGLNGDFKMPWAFYRKYKADIDVWRIISVKKS